MNNNILGPQKSPSSVAKIEAERKFLKRELEMVSIKVKKPTKQYDLIKPTEMLNDKHDHGTVFRGHFQGKPCQSYYICCGPFERSVINIWYSDEDKKYCLSTSDMEDLETYVEDYKVFKIDAEIIMEIKL